MDYPEPPEGGTVLSPYHVCDLTALICLATIVADSSFPALQRLARLGLIQVSAATELIRNFSTGSPEIVPTGMVVPPLSLIHI